MTGPPGSASLSVIGRIIHKPELQSCTTLLYKEKYRLRIKSDAVSRRPACLMAVDLCALLQLSQASLRREEAKV